MHRFCSQPTYHSYRPALVAATLVQARTTAAAAAVMPIVHGVVLVVVLLPRLSRVEVFSQHDLGGGSQNDK